MASIGRHTLGLHVYSEPERWPMYMYRGAIMLMVCWDVVCSDAIVTWRPKNRCPLQGEGHASRIADILIVQLWHLQRKWCCIDPDTHTPDSNMLIVALFKKQSNYMTFANSAFRPSTCIPDHTAEPVFLH